MTAQRSQAEIGAMRAAQVRGTRGSVQPITPDEVVTRKKLEMPPVVLEVFNTLIARNWDGRSSEIKQDEVVSLILEKDAGIERCDIFDNGYLDVEPIYEQAGWTVEYEKPGYNEMGHAYFTFKRKRAK